MKIRNNADTGHIAARRGNPEPPLAEMLRDPIVHLVMRRDQISEETLVEVIDDARRSMAMRAGPLRIH